MAEYRGRKPKKQETSPELAVFDAIIGGIGTLFKMLFQGSGEKVDRSAARKQIQDGWEVVELHLTQEDTSALAVSEADKILDVALKALGVKGETLGERLRSAESRFPQSLYQEIWDAHKVRNTLAHEIGAQISQLEAKRVVGTFRSALYHLGFL